MCWPPSGSQQPRPAVSVSRKPDVGSVSVACAAQRAPTPVDAGPTWFLDGADDYRLSSQLAAFFLLGWTRGGSPGIFGVPTA